MGDMLPVQYGQTYEGSIHDYTSSHAFSVLYGVLAIGALLDPLSPGFSDEARGYSELARGGLSLQSIFVSPSVLTVQALLLAYVYDSMTDSHGNVDTPSKEQTRGYVTVAAQISQIVSTSLFTGG
jgi:hypothetical protein